MRKLCCLKLASIFLFFSMIYGCSSMYDYYVLPENVKGNAWKILQDDGHYTTFLKAIEKIGYKDLVNGKGIITVIAPDDEAFEQFFAENADKGYNSIEDIPNDELAKIINFHLVYYSFNQDQFANFNPMAPTPNPEGQEGLFFKHRTRSQAPIENFTDPITGRVVKLFRKDRFLPIFSGYYFKTKKIDPVYNYSYFYPNTDWNPTAFNQFNISDAKVEQYAIQTDNGFIYKVSKVITPMETIYKNLVQSGDYSTFIKTYDRFSTYFYDENATLKYATGNDSLFIHFHGILPTIDSEWSYNGEGTLEDYQNLGQLSLSATTIFAPTNNAMSAFFSQYWSDYGSIDSVKFTPLKYFMLNHFSESMLFPEEITRGDLKTPQGTPLNFDVTTVSKKTICNNGAIYGLSTPLTPPFFTNIYAPLVTLKRFNMQAMLMYSTNADYMLFMKETPGIKYKIFLANDKTMESSTINGKDIRYYNPTPKIVNTEEIQTMGENWTSMSATEKSSIVNNQIVSFNPYYSNDSIEIYQTQIRYQYLLVWKNENRVQSTELFNLTNPRKVAFKQIHTASNGNVYELIEDPENIPENKCEILLAESRTFKTAYSINASEHPSDYIEFFRLCGVSGAISQKYPFWSDVSKTIVFVPISSAVKGSFLDVNSPSDEQKATMMKQISYHFATIGSLTEYPFPGKVGNTRELSTRRQSVDESGRPIRGQYDKIKLIDRAGVLYVQDGKGNERKVLSVFPHVYTDAAVYLIDGLLENPND